MPNQSRLLTLISIIIFCQAQGRSLPSTISVLSSDVKNLSESFRTEARDRSSSVVDVPLISELDDRDLYEVQKPQTKIPKDREPGGHHQNPYSTYLDQDLIAYMRICEFIDPMWILGTSSWHYGRVILDILTLFIRADLRSNPQNYQEGGRDPEWVGTTCWDSRTLWISCKSPERNNKVKHLRRCPKTKPVSCLFWSIGSWLKAYQSQYCAPLQNRFHAALRELVPMAACVPESNDSPFCIHNMDSKLTRTTKRIHKSDQGLLPWWLAQKIHL